MGRPKKYTKEFIEELHKKFIEYIDFNDIPILSEFASKNGLYRQQIYELFKDPPYNDAIKMCHTKKEAGLERNGLLGKIDRSVAIFSLKQLGWKDTQTIGFHEDKDELVIE